MATPPMHTETKHDLGRLTVTEVREPQKRYRPSIQHTYKVECEFPLDTVDLNFEIEYSRCGGNPYRGGYVEDLRAALIDCEPYCDKSGAATGLERMFRENVERRFNEHIREGDLCDELKVKCMEHWRAEFGGSD